ncbi:MAG: hypothetical protein OWT27_07580 [Firmicutes bacterium]|nr:hypothetical protein [Bacillota bacterium]
MDEPRIGKLKVEMVMTDELREALMQLATARQERVLVPMAVLRHVVLHHAQTHVTRCREIQFRRLTVDQLELVAASRDALAR